VTRDREARVLALRMRAQHLDGRLGSAYELVRAIGGVQAQEPGAAALSIRARTEGVTRADVDAALERDRSLVRMWAMRGTLHVVPAEDARWLQELFEPQMRADADRGLTQLGVPHADRRRAAEAIVRALDLHGPLTRAVLMEHVERAGVATDGQKAAHLPRLAALEGDVVFGPPAGSKPTYALWRDWLGGDQPSMPRGQALAELARRYVHAYAPTGPRDFATWSGLPAADARAGWQAIAADLVEAGADLWMPAGRAQAEPPDPPLVRMLPAFDTYLLGYRTRALAVPDAHARQVWPGGGIVRPTVVENGRAVATWRQRRSGRRVAVSIEAFSSPGPDAAEEIAHIGRFLAADTYLAGC
jgi:hypothetical protein